MEHPNELELFLQNQTTVGQSQGEAGFTLAREKALKKMADFMLPSKGDWAVKVFQFLVACRPIGKITITQGRTCTTFTSTVKLPVGLLDVEQKFFNPDPHKDNKLNHLASALWAVGVAQKRGFQISVPKEKEALFWSGADLFREPRKPTTELQIVVTHDSAIEPDGGFLLSSSRNSEVLKALRGRCFTSPVALLVDGLRLDGLHMCPEHGLTKTSFPLTLGFTDGDLPHVAWPPGTIENVDKVVDSYISDGGGLIRVTRQVLKRARSPKFSSMAFFVTAHVNLDLKRSKATAKAKSSTCYWVQDGAMIDHDRFAVPALNCSVGCYLSAESLTTDLTGLSLSETEERRRRLRRAAELLLEPLRDLAQIATKEIREHNQKRYRKLGNSLILLNFGIGIWSPVAGVLLLPFLGIFGLFARGATRLEEAQVLAIVSSGLKILKEKWAQSYS